MLVVALQYFLTYFCLLSILVPSEPQNFVAITFNSTSIKVSWKKPRNTYGRIVNYVVYYRETAKKKVYKKTIGENRSHTLLISLEVHTNYSIYMRAFTVAGAGNRSETETVKTAAGNKEIHALSDIYCSYALKTLYNNVTS